MRPEVKYRVIYRHKDKYSISEMCRLFDVSRSGYYGFVKRMNKPAKDLELSELIRECQVETKQTYGYRRVAIWLERKGVHHNPKTILRVMNKYSLLSVVRRRRYCNYSQALHRYDNLLNRDFHADRPNQKWVTDISYIKTAQGLLQLHSDQGFQYTSQPYFNLTKAYHITPSMSRRGNPYDNALAENFFSILKTECIYRTKFKTFADAKQLIDDYIYFYNHQRIQLKTKLTPLELRSQFVA